METPRKSFREMIRTSLRYKLLVLVLFPILLIMPIFLLFAVFWGSNFSYEQLLIKVNTDLAVADDHFIRIREDYLNSLSNLAESHGFYTALESKSDSAIATQLQAHQLNAGFSYLYLLDRNGNRYFDPAIHGHTSPSLLAAMQGTPRVGIEILSADELEAVSPGLAKRVKLSLIDTRRARPTERKIEERGMMIRAIYPVSDSRGEVIALLDGGVLLNGNFDFVDTIRDLVYGPGSLPVGSLGTVTVFLDDVRITTNVPRRPKERALGTRVSDEVRTQVLDHGEKWIDRAFVVNDWYISSYQPILDVNGDRVGMLYAGFLEAPFRNELWQALIILILFFLGLMLISGLLSVWGAKSIFKPLEMMSEVVHATRQGISKRIGEVDSQDEIGVLARELDVLLELLRKRNQEIQEWADQLEDKVDERTGELKRKNEKLVSTIQVLRETRAQLIAAEKLAALGELTAGVAHEINNPTAVIIGNLDLLVDDLGEQAEPVRNEIDLIIEQVFRIKEIIHNLLDYAKQEQVSDTPSLIDVNEVVQNTQALVRHLQKNNKFELRIFLHASQPVSINPSELQQVLVNLVVNAVHALNDDDGQIEIETKNWLNKGVVICVRDNGIGMDEQTAGQIFNPFFSQMRNGRGTGLGLSISYGLVRKYGGGITVETKPGEGAEFSVWLLHQPPREKNNLESGVVNEFNEGDVLSGSFVKTGQG
ncbi:MAG: cache domain-containing protein [Candidatus Thiodiazotropha sp. (ex Monitilora ramsayi)]|nr:cache domain-containing protein [Candidatus Thiodiazotropha sp. (ex Monitilora ramsayi)]